MELNGSELNNVFYFYIITKIEFNQAEAISNFTKSHKGNSLKHVLIISGITVPILIIFIVVFVLSFDKSINI